MPLSTVYIRFALQPPPELRRSPLLERLIAAAAAPVRIDDWRSDAWREVAGGPRPPIAVAAWHAAQAGFDAGEAGSPGTAQGNPAWVCIATPVHLRAGMSSVTMPADGVLELNGAEAHELAADFNRVFRGADMRLRVGPCGGLLCMLDADLAVACADPGLAAGHDVFEYQPSGQDAPRLRRMMSEIEMWLFDHPLNRTREANALAPVTALWLWGGGATAAALPGFAGFAAGSDPLFSAFGDAPAWPAQPGAGVVVSAAQPGSAAWAAVERHWLEPAALRLRTRQISRLDLCAGSRRISVGAGRPLKFWRRARPWWETFGDGLVGECE